MKKILALVIAASALFAMTSCEKYEDGRPSRATIDRFEEMYPGAWDIEWDYEGAYWEVSFETGSRPNGTEHSAKYDMSGNWLETKTEVFYSNVPQAVRDALEAEYGDARVADNTVDYYQTPSGDFYRFEIIINGRDVEVDVDLNGKVTFAGYDY